MADDIDPVEEDDDDIDPSSPLKPKSAMWWLAAIADAERVFRSYQSKADNIDKLYADLTVLASDVRDREFQLFWANVEVLKPSIYARPPVPVCMPKFQDRRPLYRIASELVERSSIVAFDLADIDQVMRAVRDDLAINARGAGWVRYETKQESGKPTERVCIEHKDRKDFLHEPAREWAEVGWVAGAAYLTKRQMRKRFRKTSGDAYMKATFTEREDRDLGGADHRQKAKVWEVWSKTENRVVWVTEGVDVLLDDGEPHLKLEGFFPCPRPAYATVQRRSLIPVPDMLYYKDQLEEINEITGRIHALADSLQVRGFYPAGAGEIGDAIEAALRTVENRQLLIPISNWAMLGNGNPTDMIVWLPVEKVAEVLMQLVTLRKEMIDDVYQIMGLSDIMRGATDANETLGAQQLKSQYGSVRIRDKIAELVRFARDLVRISAEIMAENFSSKTLLDMSQLEIPTDAEIERQVKALYAQGKQQIEQMAQQALANPEIAAQAKANPKQARAMIAQATQQVEAQIAPQVEKLEAQPTIEQVMDFLRDQRVRPFVLDIETDSTIQPDENAEKERRTEFMGIFMQSAQGLGQMIAAAPESAAVAGTMLKFVLAPYRVGRELDTAIDDFVAAAAQKAGQPNPQAEIATKMQELEGRRVEAEVTKANATAQKAEADAKRADAQLQMQFAELQAALGERDSKAALEASKTRADVEKTMAQVQEIFAKIEKMGVDADNATRQQDREDAQVVAQVAGQQADREQRVIESERSAAMGERQQTFSEQQANQQP